MNRSYARLWPVAACLLFCVPGPGRPQAWAQEAVPFRSADGKTTGWKVSIPGKRPLATPAFADGKIFVGGGFGSHEFYALDAATGKRIWLYTTGDDGPTAAAVQDGFVAFNTESCELELLTTDGKRLWKKWLGDPLMSMPAIADGVVYMAYPGGGKYFVAAFEIKTGRELWKYAVPTEIITTPVIARNHLYVATTDGTILSLNRNTGAKIWEERKNATSAPAVWKEQVYFSRRDARNVTVGGKAVTEQSEVMVARGMAPASTLKELSATRQRADYLDYSKRQASKAERLNQQLDGTVGFAGTNKGSAKMAPAMANLGQASVHGIWSYQGSKPFVYRGRLYSSMGNRTRSVEPETGTILWSRELNKDAAAIDEVLTPPAMANGKVFVGTSRGDVYAMSADKGDILWKVNVGEPVIFQLTVARGRVYAATSQGSLFCLNTGDPRDDGWYMWGANAQHNGPAAQ